MSLSDTRTKINDALRAAAVLDPHCHLDPERPCAGDPAEIVLYHHVWIEAVSAGMGQFEVSKSGLPHELTDPGIEPLERARRVLPFLPRIRNTTVGLLLRWLLEDLFDLHGALTAEKLDRLASLIEERSSSGDWEDRLYDELCRIERCVSVEAAGKSGTARVLRASEALRLVNIADGKRSPREVLAALGESTGREIRAAEDYRDALASVIAASDAGELTFLGAWVLPCMTDELATEEQVSRILAKAREGRPLSPSELGSVTFYGMSCALEELRKTPLRTIQMIVGAEVLPPHRAVTHWNGRFCGAASRLACRFEDFRFNLSTASDLFTQDTAVMAKHIPNVSVAAYWWHTLYPHYIRKSLETRLDAVPAGKIIAYFSDAYHAEWCYPKLKLVKQILADILIERVDRGWYTLDQALELIPTLFYDAPKAIYALEG
jgi:hypothetical protein